MNEAWSLEHLDHANVQTEASRFPLLAKFYTEILGLVVGPRPPFRVDGMWLYCPSVSKSRFDGPAIVHLVVRPDGTLHYVDRQTQFERSEDGEKSAVPIPRMDHFAIRATGNLRGCVTHLRTHNVPYKIVVVPGLGTRQVNVRDPDGNLIEIQFPSSCPLPPASEMQLVHSVSRL